MCMPAPKFIIRFKFKDGTVGTVSCDLEDDIISMLGHAKYESVSVYKECSFVIGVHSKVESIYE